MKILFVNNLDSFVYNLVDYVCQLEPDARVVVTRNDLDLDWAGTENFDRVIISPGPGHPKYDTNNVIPLIRRFGPEVPILGVCLGHQAICEAFGEDDGVEYVGRSRSGPVHGKISKIFHDGEGVYRGIPNPTQVVRYHSLAAKSDFLPRDLKITAMADDGTIMGVRHRKLPVEGVQFHPESIMMKPHGMRLLRNFLSG
ncbi:MAG: anthranilate synthase component II [Promethearchaeota archaeon]